jgi:hypothetical protein
MGFFEGLNDQSPSGYPTIAAMSDFAVVCARFTSAFASISGLVS